MTEPINLSLLLISVLLAGVGLGVLIPVIVNQIKGLITRG